ncbi:uncharacterized protein RCC_06130 [Ramularia collo-cygni]|uniref:Peptidase A1 domain-containing protein n=1 Tax=Ramularia collo-cygni TaxID=112498 RepID=A0A2D3USG3_9PEZI|nr:uncharacterized protein RCC_06130 [Ramularia collo-cygni]CZT20272.1 uncharacterized protein RCC_06130 [Ramularia collo-cygni]
MTSPSPFILDPGSRWYGNDGNWSTFNIGVGQPFQQFTVLPSTRSADIWVPVADGCAGLSWNGFDCANSRGVGTVQGVQSPGFLSNESTSWQQLGLYRLPTEDALYGSENNGLYGLDTLALSDNYEVSLYNWTIAGIATPDFWLGMLGLGSESMNITVLENSTPSLLTTMKADGKIPSISYGYAAGAFYESSPGSLILGGWDEARLSDGSIVVPNDDKSDLFVNLKSLVVSNSLQGTISFPDETKNLTMAIDSTTSQIWLPRGICDKFESAFGLVDDPNTGLYLVNATTHSQLLNLNPEFTFTLAANASTSSTTNIVLPYAALDLTVGVPFYNSSSTIRYMPIRRADNSTQYTLGRALLQEAYLIVDYERSNFTIGQTSHNKEKRIVPITSPRDRRGKSLGSGAIAGIVVGGVVALVFLTTLVWYFFRQRSKTDHKIGEA